MTRITHRTVTSCGRSPAAQLLACILVSAAIAATAYSQNYQDAQDFLANGLVDKDTAPSVLMALKACGDEDMLPIFAAMTRSQDKTTRLSGTSVIGKVVGKSAAPALIERLRDDTVMVIRIEALVQLMAMDAADADLLIEATKINDEQMQCIAARGLIKKDRIKEATEVLKKLTGSHDTTTSAIAKMSLLGLGYSNYAEPLETLMLNRSTESELVAILLEQIADEKITGAADIVEKLAAELKDGPTKVWALRTMTVVSTNATKVIAGIINKSERTVYRVTLLGMLADQKDAASYLEKIGEGDDAVATLARFELARGGADEKATKEISRALESKHPVVINYILTRCREDTKKFGKKADFYTPALLEFVNTVPEGAREIKDEDFRKFFMATRVATAAADIGTETAFEGLSKILAGPYGARKRVVAAALHHTSNEIAKDLARPLLECPYEEIAFDAALTLGRFGDPGAASHLRKIIANETLQAQNPELVSLACWYLLKTGGLTAQAAKNLAIVIK